MKTLRFSLMFLGLVLAAGCTNTRITNASEYDSVYFSSKDKIGGSAQNDNDDNDNQRYADNSREDDFQYSRRLRRFGANTSVSNWRYYDPYYSNDLYYAIGTPSWNTWNNYGWYNCTSPYLGSPYGYWGYDNPAYNWGNGFYNPYFSMGSYNPWMNSYYGYTPYCIGGYYGYNPYGGYFSCYNPYNSFYYNNGFNNGFAINYNKPTNVWHHGATNSFVGATAATNGGTVRPTPTTSGGKATSFTHNGNVTSGNANVAETEAPKYLKPRSIQEFNNQPPKTFTNTEMNSTPRTNAPQWNKATSPTNTNNNFSKGGNVPAVRNNTPSNQGWNKSNSSPTPAPIRSNPPAVRPQTSPSNSNWNNGGGRSNSSSGNSSFSRPSGGGGSSSGGFRRK